MTGRLTVDGQRQPRPDPLPASLPLRDTDILQLPQPLVFEHRSMAPFYEANGWIDTEPDRLDGEGA